MLATAAFGKVLDTLRRPGPVPALRPEFLLTARHLAGIWAAEGQQAAEGHPTGTVWEHPARPAATGPESPDTPRPPENRRLAFHAFQAMPAAARCLLWHTDVEAEPISVPAGLLGIDPESARTEREHAGELFRSACVRAHIELASDPECRHYNRLLDVSLRRGGALLPDIQRHLALCAHCAYATEQFVHPEGRPAVLLAEAVLGPHARRYLDSRPGRRGGARGAGVRRGGRHSVGGRPRVLPRVTVTARRVLTTPGVPRTVLLGGLGLVAVGLLAVSVAGLTPGDGEDEAMGPAAPIGTGTSTTSPTPARRASPVPARRQVSCARRCAARTPISAWTSGTPGRAPAPRRRWRSARRPRRRSSGCTRRTGCCATEQTRSCASTPVRSTARRSSRRAPGRPPTTRRRCATT